MMDRDVMEEGVWSRKCPFQCNMTVGEERGGEDEARCSPIRPILDRWAMGKGGSDRI